MVELLATAAVLGLGYSVYSGEQQASAARQGRRDQERAQDQAESAARRQARQADEDENRARQRAPDLDVLLARELRPRKSPQTIDADRLLLGRPGVLGY